MTLRSKSACQASSPTFSKGAAAEVPALLSRMSTPPNCRTVAATTASHSEARDTSADSGRSSAPAVALRISSAARSSTSLRRAHMVTRAPDRARRSTAARPSPSLPPVTIAILPLSPRSRVSMARKDSRRRRLPPPATMQPGEPDDGLLGAEGSGREDAGGAGRRGQEHRCADRRRHGDHGPVSRWGQAGHRPPGAPARPQARHARPGRRRRRRRPGPHAGRGVRLPRHRDRSDHVVRARRPDAHHAPRPHGPREPSGRQRAGAAVRDGTFDVGVDPEQRHEHRGQGAALRRLSSRAAGRRTRRAAGAHGRARCSRPSIR